MSFHVHIKIADQGWILEKLAMEIAKRANYVTYGTSLDNKADIQYYCNYSAQKGPRVSPIEIAFFTHIEQEENARRRFFDVAGQMNHCISMSERYANVLREAGITNVSVIPCGVDLKQFYPKVRIGVIGRTYHTGRKGEALVQAVYNTPGIEWRFTGKGWPGPSTYVSDDDLCDFYNDLDYVLVPSYYEGGPMCVLEGLACGVPIIASDVGWVPDFPHIPFRNGDAESLRKVLTDLVETRSKLRASVEHVTWENWAEKHLHIFESLAERKIISLPRPAAKEDIHVALVMHGREDISLGGPSVRVPGTLLHLQKKGIDACFSHETNAAENANIAHIFNIWPPHSCLAALYSAKARGLKTVLSTIFLNLQYNQFSTTEYLELFTHFKGQELNSILKATAKRISEAPNLPMQEPFTGYHAQVRACVEKTDHVILLSEYEKRCLEYIQAIPRASSIVLNPVDPRRFINADVELFKRQYGLNKYILCVGRLEPRKNQLTLAYAARRLNFPVVFIGHRTDTRYYEVLRAVASDNALFVPRLHPEDPLLLSAFAGAEAFCLPSWSEGAPLAALEAAACGTPLVLSDRSAEPEYFGDFAYYVNPADADGICEALEAAVASKYDEIKATHLRTLVEGKFSWEVYTQQTVEAYLSALGELPSTVAPAECSFCSSPASAPIYMDVTHSFHVEGPPTGMRRVEYCAYQALLKLYPKRLCPIVWLDGYFLLSDKAAPLTPSFKKLKAMIAKGEAVRIKGTELDPSGHILVLGGPWTNNPTFTAYLRELKLAANIPLTIMIHDLLVHTMPHTFPETIIYNFTKSLTMLTQCADQFLMYSEATRNDVQKYLLKTGHAFKKIALFPMGYQKPTNCPSNESQVLPIRDHLKELPFILMVSSIVVRKNHALLLDVWRKLIEKRGPSAPRLIFIGSAQWEAEQILETIRRDPILSDFVFHLQNVDDNNLLWFYEHCLFTVYPSRAEGWGLPIVESLALGKHCITSACSSMQEVAPEFTDRLDPTDTPAWLDKIEYWLDHPEELKVKEQTLRADFAPVTWKESVQSIVDALDGLHLRNLSSPGIFPAAPLDFYHRALHALPDWEFLPGWTFEANYGYVAPLPSPPLRFRYQGSGQSFWLSLIFIPLIPAKEDIIISINSYEACRCPGDTVYIDQVIHVDAGLGYIENSRLVTLEFSTPNGGGCVYLVSLLCTETQESLQTLRDKQEMPCLKLLQQTKKDMQRYTSLRFQYYYCKLLSKIIFGSKRQRYKDKRKALKQRLKTARNLLETHIKG